MCMGEEGKRERECVWGREERRREDGEKEGGHERGRDRGREGSRKGQRIEKGKKENDSSFLQIKNPNLHLKTINNRAKFQ